MTDESHTIQVKIDAQNYTGSYTVEQGLVTVCYSQRKKTTQLGGSILESLVPILLDELVREEQAGMSRSMLKS